MSKRLKMPENVRILLHRICLVVFALSVVGLLGYGVCSLWQNRSNRDTTKELQSIRQDVEESRQYEMQLDFYGKPNKNGCLILDTDSAAGTGTKLGGYTNGTAPSTNLIIHGHTMKSGDMFGNLMLYADAAYGAEHSIIRFDSLYEEREYELIAVFYSQVYYESDTVFKYYKFFQADTQEEFDDWYENIKAMSLYDTGVEAQLGDEFITLSCCAYHVADGLW